MPTEVALVLIIYSTFLAILIFTLGQFYSLRSLYVHQFRSYDLSFYSYACLARKDQFYRQIAEEYLNRSEAYQKWGRSRNYSAACIFWAIVSCLIEWITLITLIWIWGNCITLWWALIIPILLPISLLIMSCAIFLRSIGYTKSNPCLEKMCWPLLFLRPSLLPHEEKIENTIKLFREGS